ncbi:MAG: hypothetical protein J6X01_04835 [Bacteroidales bacterium]|nr:hypothetical protein [Bacteroidales bacterium]
MIFRFSDGETVEVEAGQLQELLKQNELYLQNYLELADEIDDPSYVARGNGFCETKYSEDFIESQIAKYRQRVQDISQWQETLVKG